ncbi:hypothetical protein D3C80_1558500 [compost metagenome]
MRSSMRWSLSFRIADYFIGIMRERPCATISAHRPSTGLIRVSCCEPKIGERQIALRINLLGRLNAGFPRLQTMMVESGLSDVTDHGFESLGEQETLEEKASGAS